MTPQRKGAGKKTHTHSHSLFVSGSCVCVCVCVCVPTKSLFGGSVFLQPPKYISFSRKENSLSLCLSLSLSHTHRKKRAVCACGYKQKKSLRAEPTPCKQKKGCSFSTKKKNTPNTHTHTHTHTEMWFSSMFVLSGKWTDKQTNILFFSSQKIICMLVSRQKKRLYSHSEKSLFKKSLGRNTSSPIKTTADKNIHPHIQKTLRVCAGGKFLY